MSRYILDTEKTPKKLSRQERARRKELALEEAPVLHELVEEADAANEFPSLRPDAVGGMEWARHAWPRPLRVSSARYGAAIPFLADAGSGVAGARLGKDVLGGGWFHVDPWEFYRRKWITGTSIVQIGGVGAGKSTTAKATARRLIAQGRKVAVPSDPKGEWARVAETVDGAQVLELGAGKDRINPLDEGVRPAGLSDQEWADEVRTRRQQLLIAIISVMNGGRRIEPEQYTALDLALRDLERSTRVPTIRGMIERLRNPSEQDREEVGGAGLPLAHSLRRAVSGDLAGMFDEESTVTFDRETTMIVISTRVLLRKPQIVKAVASACTSFWIDQVVRDETSGYWVVISEEGWAEMRDPKAVELLDERQRMAGEDGTANWLIMHELSDLNMVGEAGSPQREQAMGLLSKAQIKIVHRQSPAAIDHAIQALRLTMREADKVLSLAQGEALWKIGDRSLVVRTMITGREFPYYNTSSKRAGI